MPSDNLSKNYQINLYIDWAAVADCFFKVDKMFYEPGNICIAGGSMH